MKIAVTYKDGSVFPHFGKTEEFKIYEIDNNTIVSAEVVGTNGTGHEALAGLLADLGVEAVLCGGLGQGMNDALSAANIIVVSGCAGDADEALNAYLNGELVSEEVNCDHHDHHEEEQEECGCGGDCGGDCGGGCGGCGGGCGTPQIIYEGKNAGKHVQVHYTGTLNDGTKFDSSYDRGQPLEFISGVGMMIPGFDKAVVDMEVGDEINIHLVPEEAYGERNDAYILNTKIAEMPGSENLNVGDHVHLRSVYGQPIPVTVTAKDEETITFDANHEMAGKELNFAIKLVAVSE